jgi:2-iminobutanoate/2-iminopropanoate deaminase
LYNQIRGDHVSSKSSVSTDRAPGPTAGAPYSQAIVASDLVFVAGQLPLDPDTGERVEGGIGPETEQVMRNLAAVLEAAGCGLDALVSTTVFLADRSEWAAMNEVYGRHVGSVPPARAAVEVANLPFDARIEVQAIAHRG